MKKQALVLFFLIFFSVHALIPAFQSAMERIKGFSFLPIRYTVNSDPQTRNIQQYYWDPNRDNRVDYLNKNQLNIQTSQLQAIYSDPFGPSRHTKDITELTKYHRYINGTRNNENHPQFCQSGIPLKRTCPAFYIDGWKPILNDYNPRAISNQIGAAPFPLKLNKNNVTMAFTIWGQFMDHDISLSKVTPSEEMNIQIPECDPYLDIDCHGQKFIPFERSVSTKVDGSEHIDQMNGVTGWIDGSMVYGSKQEVSNRLRTFEGGKLKMREGNFLPIQANSTYNLPDAGDERAAENLLLLSYHTIFLREHNRLCDVIAAKDSEMTDEQIYQTARNYVVALIQKITYEDFLPILLGNDGYRKLIGSYKGYDPNIDPTIINEYSTAAFRVGHALLVGKFPLIDKDQNIERELNLHEIFFRPDLLDEQMLEKLIRGLTFTITKEKDGTIIDDIRNLLITAPNHRDQNIYLDLFALNIQRARDHGIEKYNYLRKVFGLTPLRSFGELTNDPKRVELLSKFYKDDINSMDAWIGIINEKGVNGGILGELGSLIVGQTFKKLRDGDRFWYERMLNYNVLPEIKGTFLAEIIVRNTNIEKLQQNIFYYNTKYARIIDSN